MVIALPVFPLVSPVVWTFLVPSPDVWTPEPPVEDAAVKEPLPAASMLAPVPAGEFVYTAVTVMLEPPETGEMLVMLPRAVVVPPLRIPMRPKKATRGTRFRTKCILNPPSIRSLVPALTITILA
jgi:hypothetical protein